jgi:hypothetical protein
VPAPVGVINAGIVPIDQFNGAKPVLSVEEDIASNKYDSGV